MYIQEGATMPVTDKLMKLLQAPMVLLPFGQASDRQNLANERMRLKNLTKGCDVLVQMFKVSSLPPCTVLSRLEKDGARGWSGGTFRHPTRIAFLVVDTEGHLNFGCGGGYTLQEVAQEIPGVEDTAGA
jgi:hypothetical protein